MKPVGGELLVWACQRVNGDRRGLGSNGVGVKVRWVGDWKEDWMQKKDC